MSDRCVSPPVYGIETEYSCMITDPNNKVHEIVGSCHSVDVALGLYEEPKSNGANEIQTDDFLHALADMDIISNNGGMLSNGGRLYMDVSGPEYATPETTTAKDAVLRSFEGDKILLGVFGHLRKTGVIDSCQINRRIVDHNRSSRGVHLNTLTKLTNRDPSEDTIMSLATLNAAKGALFGSGGLLLDNYGETSYHHSPRLSLTDSIYSNRHILRPLVRGPFKADVNKRLSRIETVTSDALNFGWPLRASLVATNAVVGLIEMGYGGRLPRLAESEAEWSATQVGQHGADGCMVLEKFGNTRSLDVLRYTAELVLEIDDKEGQLDEESDQVIREIIDTADKMADDPYSVANRVESIGRLVAMKRKMERDKLSLDSERMCRFDYAWDWIGGGIAETLRSKGGAGWHGFGELPSPAATRKRLVTPPADTRASVRGEVIAKQKGTDSSTWSTLDVVGYVEEVLHPLATSVPQSLESYIRDL